MSDDMPPPRPGDGTEPPAPDAEPPGKEPPPPLGAVPPPLEGAPRPAPPEGTDAGPAAAGRPPVRSRRPRRRYRAFDFGRVIGGTFTGYFKNLPAILVLALVIVAPVHLIDVFVNPNYDVVNAKPWNPDEETWEEYDERTGDPMDAVGFTIGVGLLGYIATMVLSGAVCYLVVRQQQKRPIGIGEALGRGFARVLPMTGATLLIYLVFAAMFLPTIIAAALESVGGALLLGALAFIPAVMWMLSVWVTVPVCAVEGLGPIASIRRSRQLAIGHRWYLLGLGVIIYLITVMGAGIVMAPLILMGDPMVVVWVQKVIEVLVSAPLGAVMGALIYIELRAVTEGVDVDGIADVFS